MLPQQRTHNSVSSSLKRFSLFSLTPSTGDKVIIPTACETSMNTYRHDEVDGYILFNTCFNRVSHQASFQMTRTLHFPSFALLTVSGIVLVTQTITGFKEQIC